MNETVTLLGSYWEGTVVEVLFTPVDDGGEPVSVDGPLSVSVPPEYSDLVECQMIGADLVELRLLEAGLVKFVITADVIEGPVTMSRSWDVYMTIKETASSLDYSVLSVRPDQNDV